MMKKFVKMKDERIEKESNAFIAKVYPWQLALLVAVMAVKLIIHAPLRMYLLDMVSLTASAGYVVVLLITRGLFLQKAVDEQMKESRDQILTKGYSILFALIIGGEFALSLWLPEDWCYIALDMPVWFLPALVITIVMLKKGWLVWGTGQRREFGLADFRKRVIIGSLFFGVITGKDSMFIDGVFQPSGILWVLCLGGGWGIMFYFMMKGFINLSEKNADKLVEKSNKEGSDEK